MKLDISVGFLTNFECCRYCINKIYILPQKQSSGGVLCKKEILKNFRHLFLQKTSGRLLLLLAILRTAGEGGGYRFNSYLSLPPSSQTLRH